MRRSLAATLAIAATLACAVPAAAQQAEWSAADEDRSTIMRFLEREDVGGVADDMGMDVEQAGRGVLRMSDSDASRVAVQVRDFEQAMTADSITITTTALIIGLLVLIVLILIL
jgi:hypothetical protein